MRQALIAGLDPGTTAAYAFLDSEGRLVRLDSSKKADLSFMLLEAAKNGDILIVGTDKKNCPSLVQRFAARLGTRIIKPEKDLTVREKNGLIRNFKVRNEHEADALASALYAYKRTSPLLRRINKVLRETGREELSDKIRKIVIRKGTNIKDTLKKLENIPV